MTSTSVEGTTILTGAANEQNQQIAQQEVMKEAVTEGATEETTNLATGTVKTPKPETNVDWRANLPDDLKDAPSLGTFKTPADVAKAYVNAVKKIGADKIVVPTEHSTYEERRDAFIKLGLPEDISKYEVKLAEGDTDQGGVFAKFKETAFKAGVLPKQAQAIYEGFVEASKEMQAHMSAQHDAKVVEGINQLKSEWGQAFDGKVKLARAAVKHFGADDQIGEYLDESGLGNDPKLVKFLSKIGESLGEDTVKGLDASTDSLFTPARARAEIEKIQLDPAYLDGKHPNHKKLVGEMQKLFAMAYSS